MHPAALPGFTTGAFVSHRSPRGDEARYRKEGGTLVLAIPAKARYAIGALLHVGAHGANRHIRLGEISTCLGISNSYAEQIIASLRNAGLLVGTAGPGGGYRLGRPPRQINILDILIAVGSFSVDRVEANRCGSDDPLHSRLWEELDTRIAGFLSGKALGEFIEKIELRPPRGLQGQGRARGQCGVCGAIFSDASSFRTASSTRWGPGAKTTS